MKTLHNVRKWIWKIKDQNKKEKYSCMKNVGHKYTGKKAHKQDLNVTFLKKFPLSLPRHIIWELLPTLLWRV